MFCARVKLEFGVPFSEMSFLADPEKWKHFTEPHLILQSFLNTAQTNFLFCSICRQEVHVTREFPKAVRRLFTTWELVNYRLSYELTSYDPLSRPYRHGLFQDFCRVAGWINCWSLSSAINRFRNSQSISAHLGQDLGSMPRCGWFLTPAKGNLQNWNMRGRGCWLISSRFYLIDRELVQSVTNYPTIPSVKPRSDNNAAMEYVAKSSQAFFSHELNEGTPSHITLNGQVENSKEL